MIRSVEARGRPPKEPPRDPPKDPPGNRPRKRPPVPYAELHCHSAFSFLDGASTPEQLVAEALAAGAVRRWRSPTTTASTASSGSARRRRDAGLKTVYGAELSLGLPEPQLGVPDPVGEHLLVLPADRRDTGGCRCRSPRPSSPAARRADRSTTWTGLAGVADGHWLVLTGCRKGSVRRALARARTRRRTARDPLR